ncbi:MAG: SpoIID/LytB domain-containing protein [Oligoflexia bacterium]|nr:SpoIID/LytB domain-containing protein [Oligoflexia bacterium]
MFLYILAVFFSVPSYGAIAPATQSNSIQLVRVSLGTHSKVFLNSIDLIANGEKIFEGPAYLDLRCTQNKYGENYFYLPGSQKRYTLVNLQSPSQIISVNKMPYRGTITLQASPEGCLVVNTLPIEQYLFGLINKEMPSSWPMEALKAQAVAARSYALSRIEKRKNLPFDVEPTTADQVYEGVKAETAKARQAVMSTRNQILERTGKVFTAYFHANCGGKTDTPENVWGRKEAGFTSVYCPFHKNKTNKNSWSISLSFDQIGAALRKISSQAKSVIKIARLDTRPEKNGNRQAQVLLSDTSGRQLEIPAAEFRQALGNTKMKSTIFELDQNTKTNEVKIRGQGYGHGVGMCQIGAKQLAILGKTYREILSFYYPLAQISLLK